MNRCWGEVEEEEGWRNERRCNYSIAIIRRSRDISRSRVPQFEASTKHLIPPGPPRSTIHDPWSWYSWYRFRSLEYWVRSTSLQQDGALMSSSVFSRTVYIVMAVGNIKRSTHITRIRSWTMPPRIAILIAILGRLLSFRRYNMTNTQLGHHAVAVHRGSPKPPTRRFTLW